MSKHAPNLIVAAVLVVVAVVLVKVTETPIVRMSTNTHESVACASADTEWEFKPMDDPACVEVAKGRRADVEWVQ